MIGGLRRVFSGDVGHIWGIDQELKSEVSGNSEYRGGAAVVLTTPKPTDVEETNDVSMKEYYKAVLEVAIESGGWYQGQAISVAWLRMTLAGLESRPFPPEAMWTDERALATGEPGRTLPSYADLFPEEKGLASRLS